MSEKSKEIDVEALMLQISNNISPPKAVGPGAPAAAIGVSIDTLCANKEIIKAVIAAVAPSIPLVGGGLVSLVDNWFKKKCP